MRPTRPQMATARTGNPCPRTSIRWRGRRGEHGLRAQIELAKEVFVERPLDAKRARCVFGQHDDPVILRRSTPGDRERAGELTQVERVLDSVELEALARQ